MARSADAEAGARPSKPSELTVASVPKRHPLAVPITGIFILLLIQALFYASAFLIPVTTAILGYFLLNAPRRWLSRLGIPAPVASAIFTVAIGLVLFLGVMALTEPVTDFITGIPDLIDSVRVMASSPDSPFEALSAAATATEDVVQEATGSGAADPMKVEIVGGAGIAGSVATLAPTVLSQLVFAVCLLFFLVASGDLFVQKAVQVADRFEEKKQTVLMIHTIEKRLGNYLGAITLINIGLGVCIGAGMWLWEMPSPWLIGLMGATLNFIPFVGAVVGSVLAGIIALVTFMDPWTAFGVFATYYGLTAFEGQFVTPTLVGTRLRLNIVMVFLSVAFFAWIWSVMGMIVAVPMLIVVKVICDAVPKLRKIGLFLGDAEGFVPASDAPGPSAPGGAGDSDR